MNVLKSADKIGERLPELVDVFGRLRKVIGKLDFRFPQFSKLMNGKLETLFVFVDQALHLQKIVLLKGLENPVDVVPHFGFELAAAIAQREREVGLSSFFGFDLLGHDYKS